MNYDLSTSQGAVLGLSIAIKDVSGNAIDLSAYTISGGIKNQYGDSGVLQVFNTNVVNSASGIININLDSSQTVLLPINQCIYQIVGTTSDNNNVSLLQGYISIYPEVLF